MSKPRTYQTEAIIIKKTRLGEADRILTLYTPYLGKIQAVAKGVRRPRSKLTGHLELLTHSQVSLARGRNIDTIIGSQTINSFLPMKNDLWLTSCALYVIELVDQFTAAHIEDYSLFQLLLETMHQLCQADNSEMVMRYFELHLLNEVGYRPQLQHCVSCQAALEPTSNTFSSSAGGMLCSSCRQSHTLSHPLSIDTLEVLRSLQGGDYSTVSRLRVNQETSHEVEAVMRGYLRFLLERDVKSVAWLDTMRM